MGARTNQSSQTLNSAELPFHTDFPQGWADLSSPRPREQGASFKPESAPLRAAGLDLLFFLMAAVDMLIPFHSVLLPQQMLKSLAQTTDFSEQKKTKVYLKQKEILVHLSLHFPIVMKRHRGGHRENRKNGGNALGRLFSPN